MWDGFLSQLTQLWVTSSTANLAAHATSLTINGSGFDPNTANDSVAFDNGVTGSVAFASATSLTVTLTGLNTLVEGTALYATITVDGISSGSAVQVATIINPVATSINLVGNGQNALVGQAYNNPLVVTVFDQNGNPLPGQAVTFTLPQSGAGGELSNVTGTTNANGQVSETLTANHITGSFSIGVAVTGGSNPTGTFNLFNDALIDNSGAGFSATGSGWLPYSGAGYDNNYIYSSGNTGSTATWTVSGWQAAVTQWR